MIGPETPREANITAGVVGLTAGLSSLLSGLEGVVENPRFVGVIVAFVLAVVVTLVVWRIGYLALCKIWGIRRDDSD
jgi:hypothetical protein